LKRSRSGKRKPRLATPAGSPGSVALDMPWLARLLPGREKASLRGWLDLLWQEECRSLEELQELARSPEWERLGLPALVKTRLRSALMQGSAVAVAALPGSGICGRSAAQGQGGGEGCPVRRSRSGRRRPAPPAEGAPERGGAPPKKQSGFPGIAWCARTNGWRVYWTEGTRRRAKRFPLFKGKAADDSNAAGSDEQAEAEALREAVAFREDLMQQGRIKGSGGQK